jgi:hypothetical protein
LQKAEHSVEVKKLTETLVQRMIQKEQEFQKAHAGLVRTIEYARQESAMRAARLEVQYGKETVQEALSLFNTSDAKLVKNIRTCERLEETAQKLQKINSNQRWERFKYDAAHNDSVALKNIDEAIAGVACEEQQILGKLTRSSHRGEEFIENSMQCWDVKTAPKYSLEGKDIFNPESFVESIKGGMNGKENIIVNITNLQKNDIERLYEVMSRQLNIEEFKKLVVIHATDPAQSKASLDLIKHLGKL